jgi:hypothetical protein
MSEDLVQIIKKLLYRLLIPFCFLPMALLAQETIWQRQISGNLEIGAHSIVPVTTGGYAVLGYKTNSKIPGFLNRDLWLLRLNANGDTVWTRSYGGLGDDIGFAITPMDDGGFLLGGASNSKNGNDFDGVLSKVDSKGDIVWSVTVGTDAQELCYAVATTQDGGYIMAGYAYSPSIHKDLVPWLAKLDAQHQIVWQKPYPQIASKIIRGLRILNDGTIVAMLNRDGFSERADGIASFTKNGEYQSQPLYSNLESGHLSQMDWPGTDRFFDAAGNLLTIDPVLRFHPANYSKVNPSQTPMVLVITKWKSTSPAIVPKPCSNWTPLIKPPMVTSDLTMAKNGTVWIATYGSGIYYLENNFWIGVNKESTKIPSNIIAGMGSDNSGNLWLATPDSGLVKFNGTSSIVFNTANSPIPSNDLSGIRIDSLNQIWICLHANSSWIRFDGATQWTLEPQDPCDIKLRDVRGKLWYLDGTQLAEHNPTLGNPHVASVKEAFSTGAITLDTARNLLLTVDQGLGIWKDCPDQRRTIKELDIAIDPQGRAIVIWKGDGEWRSAGIFGQRYNVDLRLSGNPIKDGSVMHLDSMTKGVPSTPRLAIHSSGKVVAGWINNTLMPEPVHIRLAYERQQILYTRFTLSGETARKVDTLKEIANPVLPTARNLTLAMNDSAQVLFGFVAGGNNLWGHGLAENGAGSSFRMSPFQDEQVNGLASNPVLVSRSNGEFISVAAFANRGAAITLLDKHFNLKKNIVLDGFGFNTHAPAVASFQDGSFAASFLSGDKNEIYLAHFDEAGFPKRAIRKIFTGPFNSDYRLVVDSSGALIIAWLQGGQLRLHRFGNYQDTLGQTHGLERTGLKTFALSPAPENRVAHVNRLLLASLAEGEDTVRVEFVNTIFLPKAGIVQAAQANTYNFETRVQGSDLLFTLPASSWAKVDLLNLAGRVPGTLWNGRADGKSHLVSLQGLTGPLIVRLQSGSKVFQRMVFAY